MAFKQFDESEYCHKCKETYPDWEAFHMHKLNNPKHIACIFCGNEYKTQAGRKNHQDQFHNTQQNLKCTGCGDRFSRAGSYVAHIELKMCPVIHKDEVDQRRKGIMLPRKDGDNTAPILSIPQNAPAAAFQHGDTRAENKILPTINNLFIAEQSDEDLLVFDDNPIRPAWGSTVDKQKTETKPVLAVVESLMDAPAFGNLETDVDNERQTPPRTFFDRSPGLNEIQFPALMATNITDQCLSGDKLDAKGLAWIVEKDLIANAPKPISPQKKVLEMMGVGLTEHDWHPFDPDKPHFNIKQYRNNVTGKWRCAWPNCRKLQKSEVGLKSHLKSPTHMDIKLRCPTCLRQFTSATALIQHGESQAKRCFNRKTDNYRQALEQFAGGVVEVKETFHVNDTIEYKSGESLARIETNERSYDWSTEPQDKAINEWAAPESVDPHVEQKEKNKTVGGCQW